MPNARLFRRSVAAVITLALLAVSATPVARAMELPALNPGGRQLTLQEALPGLPMARVPEQLNGFTVARAQLEEGGALFLADWRSSPDHPGALGPRFDAVSCASCHVEAGPEELMLGPVALRQPPVVLRLLDDRDRARHGAQLHRSGPERELPADSVSPTLEPIDRAFPDGTPYTLWRPTLARAGETGASNPRAAGAPSLHGSIGLRAAPSLFGWGLLEAVPDQVLLAVADPTDRNGDGIRGQAKVVWNIERQRFEVGRFGWKAEQPTLRQQTAAALHHDMGITTSLFPGHPCAPLTQACRPELSDLELERMVEFVRHLGVPERRRPRTAERRRGERLFSRIGCSHCHLPVLVTATDPNPGLSEQVIWPYTDLLLHDMGPELADPDGADARLWRTAPLWGVGRLEALAPARGFLHDGRAGSLLEAVLWHGGEAEAARRRFESLAAADREALIEFLRSL